MMTVIFRQFIIAHVVTLTGGTVTPR